MLIEYYYWNDTLPTGNILCESITTDIIQFEIFITSLDGYGYEFKGYNTQGVIINCKEILPTPTPLPPVDTSIESRVITLESNMNSFETRIIMLETNVNNFKQTKGPTTEVTDDFFILLDLLPKHIRKELKIYIK